MAGSQVLARGVAGSQVLAKGGAESQGFGVGKLDRHDEIGIMGKGQGSPGGGVEGNLRAKREEGVFGERMEEDRIG